jgi:hypothetical protein
MARLSAKVVAPVDEPAEAMAITFAPPCSDKAGGVLKFSGSLLRSAEVVATSSSIVDLTFKRETSFF